MYLVGGVDRSKTQHIVRHRDPSPAKFIETRYSRAYEEDEPEYTADMLKWVNPDYVG